MTADHFISPLELDHSEASHACHALLDGTAAGAIAFIEFKQTLSEIRRWPTHEREK